MHLSEFKAWFEGYTEEMSGTPTKAQWAKIKQRVSEISNDYTPPQIFFDRYVYPYRPYFPPYYWTSTTTGVYTNTPSYTIANISTPTISSGTVKISDWSAAGKAEYLSSASPAIHWIWFAGSSRDS